MPFPIPLLAPVTMTERPSIDVSMCDAFDWIGLAAERDSNHAFQLIIIRYFYLTASIYTPRIPPTIPNLFREPVRIFRGPEFTYNPVFEALRVNSLRSLIANVEFYERTGLRCGVWHILTRSNRLFRVEVRRLISKRCQPPGEDARLNS